MLRVGDQQFYGGNLKLRISFFALFLLVFMAIRVGKSGGLPWEIFSPLKIYWSLFGTLF